MVLETVVRPLPLLRHFKSSSRGVRGVGVGSKGGYVPGCSLGEKSSFFVVVVCSLHLSDQFLSVKLCDKDFFICCFSTSKYDSILFTNFPSFVFVLQQLLM